MEVTRDQKIVLTVASVLGLMLFARMETATLLSMIVAVALMILGLMSYSRPTSVIGMMIASGSAAASLGQESLTVVGNLLNITIGLFVPIYLLAWIALSAEEESRPISIRRGPAVLTAIFSTICLLSVGLVAFTLGVVAPAASIGMSLLMEIAIILLSAAIGITILTYKNPEQITTGTVEEAGGSAENEA